MSNMNNSVQLIGFLGKDIELKSTATGISVGTVSIATSDSYKNANGEWIEDTQWHNLVIWGKVAENMVRNLGKGSRVGILGKLMHRSYDDAKGIRRYVTEVRVSQYTPMGKLEKSQSVPAEAL